MKRLFVVLAALALSVFGAAAQDYNAAIEAFNNGAQTLEANKEDALAQFRSALSMFEACEDAEAAEMVVKCKEIIAGTMLSIAKEQINNADYDAAVSSLKETAKVAGEYGQAEVVEEANELIPNAWLRKGSTLLKAKDFAGAAAALKEVVALNPEDGQTWLLLGQARMQSGDNDGAVEALGKAAEFGKEEQANKMLSNLYLKQGSVLLKGNKTADAIAAFEKSNSYLENAQAYKLMASAQMKSGKNAAAIDSYKKYLELSPEAKDASDVKFTIAAAAQKAGDKATAIEYYQMLTGDSKYAAQATQQLGILKK